MRVLQGLFTKIFLSSLIVLVALLPLLAEDKVKITKIEMINSTLKLTHTSASDIRFQKRIYDIPARLVFDIINSELSVEKWETLVPDPDIKELRVAQFNPDTVRVVAEGKSVSALEKIKIDNVGQSLYFQLSKEDIQVTDHKLEKGSFFVKGSGPLITKTILLDKPERLVVDIIGSKLQNAALKTDYHNGNEKIKVAQFDESTVRIVFTGEESHKRVIKSSIDKKEILITGKDQSQEKPEREELKDKVYSLNLISYKDDESLFIIKSTKTLDYKHMILHNPERLVIDLFDIAFEPELQSTQFKETKLVKDVRFGIATLGKPVTRVVFDLKQENLQVDLNLNSSKTDLNIKIITDKKEKEEDIPQAYKASGLKVVIDPGHGGYDPGAVRDGHQESDITLKISKKLVGYLERAGIKAYLTRTEDRFISLAERVEISNSIRPEIFVSVHINALATNDNMEGLQTYYYSTNGYKLGSVIHRQLLEDIKMPDQRIRKARFWVTRYTAAPSVLLELGFITNSDERKKLTSDSYQTDLAKSVARGIIQYLEAK